MKAVSAKDAKNGFGRLLDQAQAEPVQIEKHGRPVAVVMSVDQFNQLATPKANAQKKVWGKTNNAK